MNEYYVGQVVRVDLPRTYGTIARILEEPINFSGVTYGRGGVEIKLMNPKLKLFGADYGSPEKSIYPFDHPIFGHAFHSIDAREELERLIELQKAGQKEDQMCEGDLEKAITFLKTHLTSPTLEIVAQ